MDGNDQFPRWPILVILLLSSFALRVIQLGDFSFWFDEVGQILIGRAQNLMLVLQGASAHYGATPLDYVITWLGVHAFGESEFILRFFPATWGMITVALCYVLGESLQRGLGDWTGLFVAVSPLAIHYSQELRFYSLGLMLGVTSFVVVLRVAKGLLRASLNNWLLLTALMTATIYTYAYGILIWGANAITLIFLSKQEGRLKLLTWFGAAACASMLLFTPWLLGDTLQEKTTFTDAAGVDVNTLRRILTAWEMPNLTPIQQRNTASYPYPYVVVGLHLVALVVGVRQMKERKPLLFSLTVYYIIATLAVAANDLRVGYFFAPRQVLILLPVRVVLMGLALRDVKTWLLHRINCNRHRFITIGLFATFILLVAPSVYQYHIGKWEKSNAESVVEYIVKSDWRSASLWIIPGFQHLTLDFYFERVGISQVPWHLVNDTYIEGDTLSTMKQAHSGSIMVIQADYVTLPLLTQLDKLGFSVAWPNHLPLNDNHFIVLAKN